VIGADGSNLAVISPDGFGDPDWSPDGTRLVVTFGGNIFTMNVDGSGLTRLTNTQNNYDPSWSPDGSKIVFRSGGLWVMNADGSGLFQITNIQAENPDWQP
jgi:Tol biopolymer transport system component